MVQIEIDTPRGATLNGSLINPVDSAHRAVVFAHPFLSERSSGGDFDKIAAAYRGAGMATLQFDFSGCGASEDAIISSKDHAEDLRSACSWMEEQNFTRIMLHAHSFGAVTALRAQPPQVMSMILTSAIIGPVDYDWKSIFSAKQLDEMETQGYTTVPDDGTGAREEFKLNKQTLADLSLNQAEELLSGLKQPTYLIFDATDVELGLVEMAQSGFSLLPAGSKIDVLHNHHFGTGDDIQVLKEHLLDWARLHGPIAN